MEHVQDRDSGGRLMGDDEGSGGTVGWRYNWPLFVFPALSTGGAFVAAAQVDGWSKDFNWWLVIIGAIGLGLAVGTAIWNAIITRLNAKSADELAANQKRLADLTQELAKTAHDSAARDVPKPVILWRTNDPYARDANERGYRIRFWMANRGQRPTAIESLALVMRNPKASDPLLADSYEWPGKKYAFWPLEEWPGQGHFTLPQGAHRGFYVDHVFEPKEVEALRKRPPLLVIDMVAGDCESSVVGTGQTLDEDPEAEAFFADRDAHAEAEYKEYRRLQRLRPPEDDGEGQP